MALYRHVAKGTFPGEVWLWTLHTEGSISLGDAQQAWEDATAAIWVGALDALVSANVVMTEVSTASLDQATGKQMSRLADVVERPGLATAETLPAQCATVVSLRSQLATRAGRGRFYLPPLAVTVMEAGRLSPTAQGTVSSAADVFFQSLNSNTLDPVLYSRTTFQTTPITQYDVGDIIDTQRRRRNKLIEQRVGGAV